MADNLCKKTRARRRFLMLAGTTMRILGRTDFRGLAVMIVALLAVPAAAVAQTDEIQVYVWPGARQVFQWRVRMGLWSDRDSEFRENCAKTTTGLPFSFQWSRAYPHLRGIRGQFRPPLGSRSLTLSSNIGGFSKIPSFVGDLH
jgi:hypothetical protein